MLNCTGIIDLKKILCDTNRMVQCMVMKMKQRSEE